MQEELIAKLEARIAALEAPRNEVKSITERKYSIADQIDASIQYLTNGSANVRNRLAMGLDCWQRAEDCSDEAFKRKMIGLLEFLRNKFE